MTLSGQPFATASRWSGVTPFGQNRAMTLSPLHREELVETLCSLGCEDVHWNEVFGACGRLVRPGLSDRLIELRLLQVDLPGVPPGEVLTYEFAVEIANVQPGITDVPPPVTLEPIRAPGWKHGLGEAREALAARLGASAP